MNVSNQRLRELATEWEGVFKNARQSGGTLNMTKYRDTAAALRAVLAVRELLDSARPTQFAFTEAELRAIVGADAGDGR